MAQVFCSLWWGASSVSNENLHLLWLVCHLNDYCFCRPGINFIIKGSVLCDELHTVPINMISFSSLILLALCSIWYNFHLSHHYLLVSSYFYGLFETIMISLLPLFIFLIQFSHVWCILRSNWRNYLFRVFYVFFFF